MQRFDTAVIKAVKTNEGFIRDAPILGRTGILIYKKPDGTEYREYRPPDEAFKADSLKSLQGKPITIGHKAMVNSQNAGKIKPVGAVLSEGRQDGNNIVADVIIALAPKVRSFMKKDAVFICSGIIDGREEEVRTALSLAWFIIQKHLHDEEWNAVVCHNK